MRVTKRILAIIVALIYVGLYVALIVSIIRGVNQAWSHEGVFKIVNATLSIGYIPIFGYLLYKYFRTFLFLSSPLKDSRPMIVSHSLMLIVVILGTLFGPGDLYGKASGLAFWSIFLVASYWLSLRTNLWQRAQAIDLGTPGAEPLPRALLVGNVVCLVLALGWFLGTEENNQWEPAIAFITLLTGLIYQYQVRRRLLLPPPSRRQSVVRTVVAIGSITSALIITNPPVTAHIGAVSIAEGKHLKRFYAKRAQENPKGVVGSNPELWSFLSESFGNLLGSAHDYSSYLLFSISHHKSNAISVGVFGYVFHLRATTEGMRSSVVSSWDGQSHFFRMLEKNKQFEKNEKN
jgi:hypothetical protein